MGSGQCHFRGRKIRRVSHLFRLVARGGGLPCRYHAAGSSRIVGADERSATANVLPRAARGIPGAGAAGPGADRRGGGAGRGGGQGAAAAPRRADGRGERPAPPPGIDEIRISSNENPLGPGKTVLDAIVGEVPRGRPVSVQQHAERRQARRDDRRAEQGQARERRPRRRLAGDPEDADARVHVAVPAARDGARRRSRTARASRGGWASRSTRSRSTRSSGSISKSMLTVVRGAGLVFLNNPNNPTATVHTAKAVHELRRARAAHLAGHGHPDRRGVSRLRHRSRTTRRRFRWRSRHAERVRRADVLEGVRHGRHAHRLRDRRGRHDQAAGAPEDAVQRQRLRHRGRDRGAQRSEAHRAGARAQHPGARVHRQGARGAGLQGDRVGGQLHLRGHRPAGGASSATPARTSG